MKKIFLKLPVFLLTYLTIAIVLNSCKKLDQSTAKTFDDYKSSAMAKLKEQVEKNPDLLKVIYPINIKGKGYFADFNENKILFSNSYTYQCVDPADMDYPFEPSLISIGREYSCTNGYRLTATWNISAPLPFFATSPINGQLSRGRIRIKNTSGTTTYSDLNITAVAITLIGDDPTTGNVNGLWGITYTTGWIPASNFTPGTSVIEHSVVAYTDCADAVSYVTGYINSGYVDVTIACNRIDPVAVNAANGSSNGDLNGFGNILFTGSCPNPPGGTYPDRQEVQIKCVASGVTDTWHNIQPFSGSGWPSPGYLNTSYNSSSYQNGTIGLYDTYYIPNDDLKVLGTITHGAYLVRYRNKMSTGCVGPWSPEISTTF